MYSGFIRDKVGLSEIKWVISDSDNRVYLIVVTSALFSNRGEFCVFRYRPSPHLKIHIVATTTQLFQLEVGLKAKPERRRSLL